MGRKPRRSFEEGMFAWLDGPAKSLKSYQRTLDHARRVRPYVEGIALQDAPEAADRMKAAMLAQGLRPATINQRLAIIRRVLNLAYQWGWLDHPLGQRIKLLPPNNARHIYLDEDQIQRLADAAGSAQDVILLLGYTGLRVSELYRVRAEDVREGCIHVSAETKTGRPRIIPLADPVKTLSLPVTVSRSELRYRFEAAREALGMPYLHLHDLRHSTAYLLIKAGASMVHIRDILGHSNLAVTSRYSHLSLDDLRGAVGKMGKKS